MGLHLNQQKQYKPYTRGYSCKPAIKLGVYVGVDHLGLCAWKSNGIM